MESAAVCFSEQFKLVWHALVCLHVRGRGCGAQKLLLKSAPSFLRIAVLVLCSSASRRARIYNDNFYARRRDEATSTTVAATMSTKFPPMFSNRSSRQPRKRTRLDYYSDLDASGPCESVARPTGEARRGDIYFNLRLEPSRLRFLFKFPHAVKCT